MINLIVNKCEPDGAWQLTLGAGPSAFRTLCAIGPKGVIAHKREGDGATPAGIFRLIEVWFRADRVPPPETSLPLREIAQDDAWCDDSAHPLYNRHVKLPFAARHERLWRDDHAYDLCVVLDYNLSPPIAGRGSAIFLHLAKPDDSGGGYKATEGCIATNEEALRRVLAIPEPLAVNVCL